MVVGASLAGLRAAEALRAAGYDGSLTLVGAEPHLPYDRPPLSKRVLSGEWGPDRIALRKPDGYADLRLDLRLGTPAGHLDMAARRVVLAGGEALPFDGLVIATGATPRRLPGVDPAMAGVHVLRTLDDCLALRDDLDAGPARVVVIGAGFIGAEVAATARARGLAVTMLEALPAPLSKGLGDEMGHAIAQVHRDHGVDVRLGVGVAGVDGGSRVGAVRLVDGGSIDADVVVVGIGVRPDTAWLQGAGLDLTDGITCDATLAAGPPGVYAAGDVARWPNRRFGTLARIEHWTNAAEQGAHAAHNLLAGTAATPYEPVPFVWSDQFDARIQVVGHASADDEVRVVAGSVAERRFLALYGRHGTVRAVLGVNMPRAVMPFRQLIAQGISWNEAVARESA